MLRRAMSASFGVELDAFDAEEGILGGEEHGAAFAGADVEEDCTLDGREWMKLLQPEVEQCAQDAGRDAVVGCEIGGGGAWCRAR